MAAPMQGYFPRDPKKAASLLGLAIDVKRDYGASGSNSSTTGSIDANSTTLTLAAAEDFANGQGISVAGAGAAGATLVTSVASGGGTTTLTLADAAGTTTSAATVSHDDTVAIQSALDVGGAIVIPAGTYICGELTASKAATAFIAKGATIKLRDDADSVLVTISTDNVRITGSGTLDGNATNGNSSYTADAVLIKASYCQVDGITIQNTGGCGVDIQGGSHNRIVSNSLETIGYIGIFAQVYSSTGSSYNLIQANTVVTTSTLSGITVHGDGSSVNSTGNRIIGNHVESATQISIEAAQLAPYTVIAANKTIGGTMGISISAADHSAVTGNQIYNPSAYGIEIADSKRCSVSGNAIDGNNTATVGIVLDGSAPSNNAVSANAIYNIHGYGIEALSGSDYSTLTGNAIDTYTGYGVNLSGSNNVSVLGGSITAGGLKAVIVDNASNVLIDGVRMDTATQNGVLLYQSGSGTTNNITICNCNITNCNVAWATQGTIGANIASWNNSGINPGGLLTTPTNPPLSGTVYQNTTGCILDIYLPVTYNPTSSAAATLVPALGNTSSPSALPTISVPAGATAGAIYTYHLRVPTGLYYSFTVTNATIGTAKFEGA